MTVKKIDKKIKESDQDIDSLPSNLGGHAPHQNRGTIGSRVEDDQDPEQEEEIDASLNPGSQLRSQDEIERAVKKKAS